MPNDQQQAHSYVLRMWKETGAAPHWRFSLESVHDGQRRGFGSLAALMAYLEQAAEHPPVIRRS